MRLLPYYYRYKPALHGYSAKSVMHRSYSSITISSFLSEIRFRSVDLTFQKFWNYRDQLSNTCLRNYDEWSTSAVITCEEGYVKCANEKQCYLETGRCDGGTPQCSDGSDEANCIGKPLMTFCFILYQYFSKRCTLITRALHLNRSQMWSIYTLCLSSLFYFLSCATC